ncbi:MAG TPA: hypothetical protein VJ927_08805 [Actinomycetota bacterium]|nr:hypothetical protein [Actinomycetota bacterium]
MKRTVQRLIATAMIVGVVGAVMPLAGAAELIGDSDDPDCRPPSAGWSVQGNPPTVFFYADPGKLCMNA